VRRRPEKMPPLPLSAAVVVVVVVEGQTRCSILRYYSRRPLIVPLILLVAPDACHPLLFVDLNNPSARRHPCCSACLHRAIVRRSAATETAKLAFSVDDGGRRLRTTASGATTATVGCGNRRWRAVVGACSGESQFNQDIDRHQGLEDTVTVRP
jgi:hypothetical protein